MSSSQKLIALGNQIFKSLSGFDKALNTLKIISVDNGNCVGEITVEDRHTNPMGTLHGGFSATLVDSFSSIALNTHEKMALTARHVTVNLSCSYLKSANVGDTLVVDSKVLRVGKTMANLDVEIRNKSTGELLVKGAHTKFILSHS